MAEFYVKSGVAAERANSTAYSAGAKMVLLRSDTSANYATARKWVWECTTAGTSGAAVPSWPASVTQDVTTVTDGGVTWTARKPGFSSGTTPSWAFAHPFMDWCATASAAGDTFYVSLSNAENYSANYSVSFPGTQTNPNIVLCVSDSAAPPTALATGATISTTGSYSLMINGCFYAYGLTLEAAIGGTASMWLAGADNDQVFEACKLRLSSTQNSQRLNFGSGGNGPNSSVKLINSTVKFGTTSQRIGLYSCRVEWIGGGIESGSAASDGLFEGPDEAAFVRLDGVDLSGLAAGVALIPSPAGMLDMFARSCKTPATFGLALGAPGQGRTKLVSIGCGASSDPTQYESRVLGGQVLRESTIKKAGSAISFKMVSNANAKPHLPVISPDIFLANTVVGAAITVSVDVLTDGVSLTDKDCWLEVLAPTTSGSPLSAVYQDGTRNPLAAGTAQTASTATWTTTGLSSPTKQKLEVTLTPQVAGDLICRVHLCKASTTVYVDPQAVAA